jgi:glycerophosphoryl diester phosphodiesterase
MRNFLENSKLLKVYLWVLNSEEEFQYALDIGANGIITDYPLRLIQFIENNPKYKTKLVRPEKL